MTIKAKYLMLYAHNIPVMGVDEGAIYDLQKGRMLHVPNILVSILKECRKKPFNDILEEYTPNNPNVLMRYISYLLENNWMFMTDYPESYPEIDLSNNETPNIVYNSIVECGPFLRNALEQLEVCCCWYAELRIVHHEDLTFLSECLPMIKTSGLRRYKIIYYFDLDDTFREFLERIKKDIRFVGAYRYSDNESKTCEKLYVSLPYFIEAQNHDTYRYKKVYINKDGDIFNVPGDSDRLGNISYDSLKEICKSEKFERLSCSRNADRQSTRYAIFQTT